MFVNIHTCESFIKNSTQLSFFFFFFFFVFFFCFVFFVFFFFCFFFFFVLFFYVCFFVLRELLFLVGMQRKTKNITRLKQRASL